MVRTNKESSCRRVTLAQARRRWHWLEPPWPAHPRARADPPCPRLRPCTSAPAPAPQPIMLGDAALAGRMASALLDRHGVYVVGFSYPVVPK